MSNKRKVGIVSVFVVLAIVLSLIGYNFIKPNTQEGKKEVTLKIESLRDSYIDTKVIETDSSTLGEMLRELDYCEWEESDYGIYVKGFYDMKEDSTNQYWWCFTVNDEDSSVGADYVELEDGSIYTFSLVEGY